MNNLTRWNTKQCSKCKEIKSLDLFHNNKSRRDGLNLWCKKCMKPLLRKRVKEQARKKYDNKFEASIKEWIDINGEEWIDIKGYEGYYQVSNKSRVRSISKGWKLKKTPINKINGYKYLGLSYGDIEKTVYLHRLVAEAFIPNPNNYSTVNHKNGDKSDASIDNLEWCTLSQNTVHSIKILERHGALQRLRSLNLGKSERLKIDRIYRQARKLTKETGIKYQVDHIEPLNGNNISGLHVSWNLRIITANENWSKNNKTK